MVKLVEAFLTNGVISYNNEVAPRPESREFRDGATYIKTAQEGVPAFFEVSFKVESTFDLEGRQVNPYISIVVPVAKEKKTESVIAIEDTAAVEVVPMLRAIADAIETQLKDYNEGLIASRDAHD